MISLLRMIAEMDRDLHNGKWNKKIGAELKGKTVVIIGFGRIGQRVYRLLSPFDVKIIAVDPYLKESPFGNVSLLPLEKALPQAEIVTLHCSGEKCILGESELGMLKAGVFLINASRGGIINEEFLIRALESGKVAGAWIDTFLNEPYQEFLIKYPQVILTPHVGSYTRECRLNMEMEAVENLIKGLEDC